MGSNKRLWLSGVVLTVLLLALSACAPAATATSPVSTGPSGPVLQDILTRDCKAEDYASDKVGLPVGEKAVNFTLKNLKGNDVRLSQLLAEKPVVLIFGSFS